MAWRTLLNWAYGLENIVQLGLCLENIVKLDLWLGEHCSIRLMAL